MAGPILNRLLRSSITGVTTVGQQVNSSLAALTGGHVDQTVYCCGLLN